jgi:hypothetical protein
MATSLAPSRQWSAGIEVAAVLVTSLLIFAWYFQDARERAFRRGYWQDFGVAGAALVGLPVYLFRSRGARGGALATGAAVLFYFGMLVMLLLGAVLGMLTRVLLGMPLLAGVG